MVIRSRQHYRRFLGAISFLYHHGNIYPRADPGNFRRVWRWGGGGGKVQARLTEKSSDVVFFLRFLFIYLFIYLFIFLYVLSLFYRGSPVIMAFSKKTIIKQ